MTKKGRPLAAPERRVDGRRSTPTARTTGPSSGGSTPSDPLFAAARHHDRRRAGEAEPDGEVPPGPGPARRARAAGRRRRGARPGRRPVGRAAAADGRPRLRQRLPDVRAPSATSRGRGLPVAVPSASTSRRSRATHNSERRRSGSGVAERVEFVQGTIETVAARPTPPDLVLALHACDTATDDALARAVAWQAPVIVAAPCCHHDIQRQLDTASVARRRTGWSPGTASCASGSPTCSPTRCARRSCGWSATASR